MLRFKEVPNGTVFVIASTARLQQPLLKDKDGRMSILQDVLPNKEAFQWLRLPPHSVELLESRDPPVVPLSIDPLSAMSATFADSKCTALRTRAHGWVQEALG